MDEKFRTLEEMGFSRVEAQEALTFAHGEIQVALDWLLTNCPQGRVGVSEMSTKVPHQAENGGQESGGKNFVPPPPIDASDHENTQHLEALKRNPSNELPKPSGPIYTSPAQGQHDKPNSTSPSEPAAAPSSPIGPGSAEIAPVVFSGELNQASPIMVNAPTVQVCYRETSDGPTMAERDKLLNLLQSEHIPCSLLDVEQHRDVEDIIVASSLSLPQAVLAYQPLGDLGEFSANLPALRRLVARKIAQGLQSEHSSSMDEYSRQPISTGAVDGVMNLIESAASHIWSPSTASNSSRPSHSFIEFTVIKTNWFFRDQRRIIRFGTNGVFYRIEPKTNELRETISYASITGITVGPSRLCLTLNNGLNHSFTAPTRVIDYMYQLFIAYAPEAVVPKIETV